MQRKLSISMMGGDGKDSDRDGIKRSILPSLELDHRDDSDGIKKNPLSCSSQIIVVSIGPLTEHKLILPHRRVSVLDGILRVEVSRIITHHSGQTPIMLEHKCSCFAILQLWVFSSGGTGLNALEKVARNRSSYGI